MWEVLPVCMQDPQAPGMHAVAASVVEVYLCSANGSQVEMVGLEAVLDNCGHRVGVVRRELPCAGLQAAGG